MFDFAFAIAVKFIYFIRKTEFQAMINMIKLTRWTLNPLHLFEFLNCVLIGLIVVFIGILFQVKVGEVVKHSRIVKINVLLVLFLCGCFKYRWTIIVIDVLSTLSTLHSLALSLWLRIDTFDVIAQLAWSQHWTIFFMCRFSYLSKSSHQFSFSLFKSSFRIQLKFLLNIKIRQIDIGIRFCPFKQII